MPLQSQNPLEPAKTRPDAPLQSQLDILANEASFLNDFSSDTVSYSSNFNDIGLNEPHVNNQSKNYLKCILSKQHGETEPLLPTHVCSPAPSIRYETESVYSMILKTIIKFFWDYILPESARNWLLEHKVILAILVLSVIVVVLIILYFTGNLFGFLEVFRMSFCWLMNNLFPDSPWARVCPSVT